MTFLGNESNSSYVSPSPLTMESEDNHIRIRLSAPARVIAKITTK